MKITDIKTFMVDFGASNYVFVKIYTDEGIEGVGEATLEGKELSVIGAIQELARNLIGQNPLDIELHWRKWHMTSCWKGVTDFSAISGLEQAMWDITGKVYNTPVYKLWGGAVREAIRATPGPDPTTPRLNVAKRLPMQWKSLASLDSNSIPSAMISSRSRQTHWTMR